MSLRRRATPVSVNGGGEEFLLSPVRLQQPGRGSPNRRCGNESGPKRGPNTLSPHCGNEALHGACDGGGGCGAAGPAALAEPTEGLLSLDSESILTSDGLCQDPVLHESVTQNCKNCSGHEDSIMTYMSWKQRLQQPYSPHPMVFRFAILGLQNWSVKIESAILKAHFPSRA